MLLDLGGVKGLTKRGCRQQRPCYTASGTAPTSTITSEATARPWGVIRFIALLLQGNECRIAPRCCSTAAQDRRAVSSEIHGAPRQAA
ncbi:hypothetical protein [Azohydromonas aeria]|uniref:hypothetical protein n=1 Tax=Azohydromonas aeria TaxID=2590212 RepID=UPI0018DFDEFE|nr:hypothetical protein [Azohydromonas aeria]